MSIMFWRVSLVVGMILWGNRHVVVVVEAANDNDNDHDKDKQRSQPPPDFDINAMMDQHCPNFHCTAKMTPTPKAQPTFESTGCASMGSGAVMMAAGNTAAKPYESCCDAWHACYQVCGVAKKTCDAAMETCAKKTCADDACHKDVDLSLMMMKLGGCQAYNQAQYQACECVPKRDAPAQRQAALTHFYQQYAPEQVDKVKNLVAKAETPAKMASLLIKLLAKYPHAIVKKEDPRQTMYEQIRQQTQEKTQSPEPDKDNNKNKDKKDTTTTTTTTTTVVEEEDADKASDEHIEL